MPTKKSKLTPSKKPAPKAAKKAGGALGSLKKMLGIKAPVLAKGKK